MYVNTISKNLSHSMASSPTSDQTKTSDMLSFNPKLQQNGNKLEHGRLSVIIAKQNKPSLSSKHSPHVPKPPPPKQPTSPKKTPKTSHRDHRSYKEVSSPKPNPKSSIPNRPPSITMQNSEHPIPNKNPDALPEWFKYNLKEARKASS